MSFRKTFFLLLAVLAGLATTVVAQTLSRGIELDFYRDIASRNLNGFATRADGRLTAGPTLTDLRGPLDAGLLWALEPSPDGTWLVGADGKILSVALDADQTNLTSRVIANVGEPQVFALKRLPNGALLAGTSPHGALMLIRDDRVVARVAPPVDSIFDILLLDANTALIATGNPGRLYRVDLERFANAGVLPSKVEDSKELASHGITLFGQVRDRNIRRIARVGERIVAGSSPRGNIYAFERPGEAPTILQENNDAEVAALLPQPNGDFFAAVVFAAAPGEARLTRPTQGKAGGDADAAPTSDTFGGRSAVIHFPKNGFPETIVSRTNVAFYALARHGDTLLMAGGEQGDLLGFDLRVRQSLSFSGSVSSQLNQLTPLPGATGRFLALRNNVPGLAIVDFNTRAPRSAETRRIDLGVPATLGKLRFELARNIELSQLGVQFRTSMSSDEVEGWSPWFAATATDDGWTAAPARARYVKLRFQAPAGISPDAMLDRASLYFLPQNRRPQLIEFRFLPPNLTLVAAPEPAMAPPNTLNQLVAPERDRNPDERRKTAFLNSTISPQRGAQVVLWTLNDPDGDLVTATFSIRSPDTDTWTDLAVNSRSGHVVFDTSQLKDGVYLTRIVATEQAPRAESERHSVVFETDEFIVDRTPPEIDNATISRDGDTLMISVGGRDALSLLTYAEFAFNNGQTEQVSQPSDGIRDSRSETFVLRAPGVRVHSATAVDVRLFDALGNHTVRRMAL